MRVPSIGNFHTLPRIIVMIRYNHLIRVKTKAILSLTIKCFKEHDHDWFFVCLHNFSLVVPWARCYGCGFLLKVGGVIGPACSEMIVYIRL